MSARFPAGTFDGHRSVLPSPDHLIFLSLTKTLMQGVFTLLLLYLRPTVGTSLREALAHAGRPCTKVYNPSNKTYVNSLGISEWAAVCVVGYHACRRAIPDAFLTGHAGGAAALAVAVDLLQDLYDVVRLACFFPRAELDGEAVCQDRAGAAIELRRRVAVLLRAIRSACARPDCAALTAVIDVPNIHRMSEAVWHAVEHLGSLRDAVELLFARMHQPLKLSIRSDNGHNDVLRAMTEVIDNETVSRLAMDAAKFDVPAFWPQLSSMRQLFGTAVPLSSLPVQGGWKAGRHGEEEANVPIAAQLLVTERVSAPFEVSWRRHCVRGGLAIRPADTVAVLVASDTGQTAVHVVDDGEEGQLGVHVSFFHVVALWVAPDGQPAAVTLSLMQCMERAVWIRPAFCIYLWAVVSVRHLQCMIAIVSVVFCPQVVLTIMTQTHGCCMGASKASLRGRDERKPTSSPLWDCLSLNTSDSRIPSPESIRRAQFQSPHCIRQYAIPVRRPSTSLKEDDPATDATNIVPLLH